MFTIGAIKWPKTYSLAIQLYLEFLVLVIEDLGIDFSSYNQDPVEITKSFLLGRIKDNERVESAGLWWNYIEKSGAIRDFQDKDNLMARLAICLLGVGEKDIDRLGENLSWFFEVLGFLGEDIDKAISLMEMFFTSNQINKNPDF